MNSNKSYAYILLIGGLVGILTSFILTLDKIELLENPATELPCNINPIISCGPVILTPQASAFGFPNPMLGLIGFSFVTMTGLLLLFGAIPDKRFWRFFTIGSALAILFIHWLIFQSVFRIGALCLYCMITWAVTWPIFLYTIFNYFSIQKNRLAVLIGWYLLIILIILFHFRDFFFS